MAQKISIVIDGNEAAASAAFRCSEIIAIYPITPASAMGELADDWAAAGRTNIWSQTPTVIEMQSEAGAAGAVHGALQGGALATTFTASQGLLLMLPNMYKIAGELTPFCMHVAARTLATHALSIFGDHSDVMACRQTGFAIISSASVQEAHDIACISHMATLASRVPFLHFFDGFRTSHEVACVTPLSDDDLRALIDPAMVAEHRQRAMTPDRPVLRGTAQNPDVFFQAREAINPFYQACLGHLETAMADFAEVSGRHYAPFEYHGHAQPERVIIAMGSGCQTLAQTANYLAARGQRVGVVNVRLYRPFSVERLAEILPSSVQAIAVLDRTKEPGAIGGPLYQDVVTALAEARDQGLVAESFTPRVVGGRYGLSSKEFSPGMALAVFDELSKPEPRNHFSIGIVDDVTHTSLEFDRSFDIEDDDVTRALFFGLGSDGTVGANKNTIKIVGDGKQRYAQGYFVYDSKKSGALTISHLRFSPKPIAAPYLLREADFVACHQFSFLDRFDMLEYAAPAAVFLLNSPFDAEAVWDELPLEVQQAIIDKQLRFYVVDAYHIARSSKVGPRINTIMQTCFFAISELLPIDEAITAIKDSITHSYAKKGDEIVARNCDAVDVALNALHPVKIPAQASSSRLRPPAVSAAAPDFVQRVTAVMLEGNGDLLPVSAFPVDGTWPLGTSRWEKRNLALEIPVWESDACIQCNKCVFACPHAAIRAKVFDAPEAAAAPSTFKTTAYRGRDFADSLYALQVAPQDCTGCVLCVEVCPAKDKANPQRKAIHMEPQRPLLEAECDNYEFFLAIPELDRTRVHIDIKGSQLLEPLFEYSGACAGCGETPYLKLLTQLFGDRAMIANATGCTSITSGNLPTTPYTTNRDGRGPAWNNSLFEDNAEFGLGMRLAVDFRRDQARGLIGALATDLGDELAGAILEADQSSESGIAEQRKRIELLQLRLALIDGEQRHRADQLAAIAEYLVDKSVWLVGGDGWAYDIGYGGLDHVLAGKRNVNVLVLDTEVYSNTGGQQSKATPLGAAAKFAAAGKTTNKKDLGMLAMTYGSAYVARVAFGANDQQTIRAFAEAESYPGPSLIIAYSHCIAHGYDMACGAQQQKLAVDCGLWPLYRFDPRRAAEGLPVLRLDSKPPKIPATEYLRGEARFRISEKSDPELFQARVTAIETDAARRYRLYQQLASA